MNKPEKKVISPPTVIDKLDEARAEECFDRGNRLLAVKNRRGAIEQFKEALSYAPHHTEISLKLAEVLATDAKTRSEAEQVLAKASQLAPNNITVRARLAELGKTPDKSRTELITPKKESSLNPDRRRAKFVRKQVKALNNLPARISTGNTVILILVGILTIVLLAISHQRLQLEVSPVFPEDQAIVSASFPEFRWSSSVEDAHYLLQIEDKGEKIIEHYTTELVYVLSTDDMKKIKQGYFYKWRVIPVSPKRIPLNYVSKEAEFRILNTPISKQKQ